MGEAAGNATKAALVAGYSHKTARQQGCRLLTRANIREAIANRQQKLTERTEVTAERVIKELSKIAFSDIRGLFNGKGGLVPVHELPEDVARALASVEVTKQRTKTQDSVTTEEFVTKVKTWDKPKALEMLGRHLALWQDARGDSAKGLTVNIGFLQQPGQPPIIDVSAHVSPSAQGMTPHATVSLSDGGEAGED